MTIYILALIFSHLFLFPGHPHSKEGRKAPEILFERESVYIWNVQISNGDLNYVLQENDKVFVEVADLMGKDKKKWQSRLGSVQVSAANRLIGEVVQTRRRPLLGPSPG